MLLPHLTKIPAFIIHSIHYRLRYAFLTPYINIFHLSDNPWILLADFLPFLKKKTVKYIMKNGLKFNIRLGVQDLTVTNEILIWDIYRLKTIQLRNNPVMIDIGSHIGIFSIAFAHKYRKAFIYAFEPQSENFRLLTNNIKLNRLNLKIKAFNKGLGKRKRAKLYLSHKNSGCHSAFIKTANYETISLVSLKNIIKNNKLSKIDLLKVDCEGGEYEILFSLNNKDFEIIDNIIFEYHDNGNIKELKTFLESKGYEMELTSDFFPLAFCRKPGKNFPS